MVNTSAIALGIALFASIAALLYNPIATRLQVFGILRYWNGDEKLAAEELTVIPDLFGVEDLHYHEPTGIVFGLTEPSASHRHQWFPPTATFNNATNLGTGTFFMLFPNEDHATRLSLEGFKGPFVTHGFDIATSPSNDEQIYFIAVNHLPNPLYSLTPQHDNIPKARSQIELFSYTIGDTSAKHLRSIVHPLIRTPNDIFAISSTSFYVTNDHRAREGFGRLIEDTGDEDFGAWSELIHVSISSSDLETTDPAAGLTVSIALSDLQNPNGLGHGRRHDEIMLVRAASGILSIVGPAQDTGKLEIKDKVQLPSCLDNPSYFHDPYVTETGRDASGFVLAGLAQAFTWPAPERNPVVVWLVQPPTSSSEGEKEEVEIARRKPLKEWRQTALFMDDGRTVNSASTALLVAIPPEESGGRKLAWLLVTGPLGVGVWRSKVEL